MLLPHGAVRLTAGVRTLGLRSRRVVSVWELPTARAGRREHKAAIRTPLGAGQGRAGRAGRGQGARLPVRGLALPWPKAFPLCRPASGTQRWPLHVCRS